jgi:hypothetical protein
MFLAGGFLLSCENKKKSTEGEKDIEVKSYLPIKDFILEDMRQIDSFAGGMLLREIINDKTDSVFLAPNDYKKFIDKFLVPELDSARFNKEYDESSLMDETTQMLNFIYTAKDPNAALKRVILYVSPSLSIDRVNRVYMEKEKLMGDTSISERLTWKMKQYFMIVENKQTPAGYQSKKIQKIIWDPTLFSEE